MSQDWETAWQRPDDEVRPGATALALDTQLADLVAYCAAVIGRESDAAGTADAVLDSVQSLLTDPDQLRAWLFALARREILAGSEPVAREVFDLVHRHGILPEDLSVVLGIPPIEADQLLADAEADYGDRPGWDDRPGWEDSTDLIERQRGLPVGASPGQMLDAQLDYLVGYCRALAGREEDALDTAHGVLDSARSLLTDPDRRRAWLFALARQEMLADAAPVPEEILDLVHRHGVRAEDLPTVLGIPPAEADQLLAAAEDEYASSAFSSGRHQAASDYSASWDDGAYSDDGAYAGDDADWDDVFGPAGNRRQDLYGRFRQPPDLAGRHAAPTFGAGRLRQALGRGPVRVAAATAIVVAVIGVSAAYLAAANSPPPSQASQQTKHHPAAAAHSPAATPSPAATDTPAQSPAPSQSVTVVVPPPTAAPTSQRPSPRPSPKPSPSPSPSPTASPSPSATPSASTSP